MTIGEKIIKINKYIGESLNSIGKRVAKLEQTGGYTVDAELNPQSTNPVQNQAVYKALANHATAIQQQLVPTVTTADNGKVLQVNKNGKWEAVSVADSAVKTYVDEYISSALEGEY